MGNQDEYLRLKSRIERKLNDARQIMRDAKSQCDGDFESDPSWLLGKRIHDECQSELDDLNRRFA